MNDYDEDADLFYDDYGAIARENLAAPNENENFLTSLHQVKIDKVINLHAPAIDPRDTDKSYCTYCSSQYPCETVRILTDEEE